LLPNFEIYFQLESRNSPTENGTGAESVPASVTGDALKLVPVNRQVSINIDLPNSADLSEVKVTVTGMNNERIIIKYQFSIVNVLLLFSCSNTEAENLHRIYRSYQNRHMNR
jgi:hypothetical protein